MPDMALLIDDELAARGEVDTTGRFHVRETYNGWQLKGTFTYDEARALVAENQPRAQVVWRG